MKPEWEMEYPKGNKSCYLGMGGVCISGPNTGDGVNGGREMHIWKYSLWVLREKNSMNLKRAVGGQGFLNPFTGSW